MTWGCHKLNSERGKLRHQNGSGGKNNAWYSVERVLAVFSENNEDPEYRTQVAKLTENKQILENNIKSKTISFTLMNIPFTLMNISSLTYPFPLLS
jgi:hypothetical protein